MAELFGHEPDYVGPEGKRKPHLDVPFQPSSCIWNPWYRFSSWLQSKLIANECCSPLLQCLYYTELIGYSSDRLGFCEARQRVVGPVFCALGRVNLAGYKEVAEVLSNPQERSSFVGRAKLDSSKCPANMLLFKSNTPHNNTHRIPRSNLTQNIFANQDIHDRVEDESVRQIVNSFISELKRAPRNKTHSVNGTCTIDFDSRILDHFVLRWMHYVILGIFIESDETEILEKMYRIMSDGGYVSRRIDGIGSILSCFSNRGIDAEVEENDVINFYIERSPVIAKYKAVEGSEDSKQSFAEQVLAILSVAAVLGGTNTLAAAFSQELREFVNRDDFSKEPEMLELFVLEVARRFAPVNHINTVTKKPIRLMVGESEVEFPAGTLLSANLNMASMDEAQFRDPFDFFPGRAGLRERTVNFNSVGLDASGDMPNQFGSHAAERVCPGRHFAIKMVSQAITAHRFGYLEAPPKIETGGPAAALPPSSGPPDRQKRKKKKKAA